MTTPRAAIAEFPVTNPALRFLEALGEGDFDALEDCLAPDVWFRALQPRQLHESTTARAAADAFRSWFGGDSRAEILETDHHTVGGREYLRYRFLVHPYWAPEQPHVIEQTGFCRIKDGRISRLDIVCSGFFPITDGD